MFATVGRERNTLRIQSLNEVASAAGLRPGMPLAEARAMFPALGTTEADPAAEAILLADLVAWCRRWTPLTGLDGPDGAMLDMKGCLHFFGGAQACVSSITKALEKQGFSTRAAMASTPAAARALARYGKEQICPPGTEVAIIGPLPIAALGCPGPVTAGLAQAGLRRIDDLAARPRAPLAARFGAGLLARLDEALGGHPSSISPIFPTPAYVAERIFQEPIARVGDVEATILRLAGQIARLLEDHGEGLRQAEVSLFRTDGGTRRLVVGASRPLRQAEAVARLFHERLAALSDDADPGFGFDIIRLSVLLAEPMPQPQGNLDRQDDAAGDHAALIDRLGARLGTRRVLEAVATERHLPEESVTLMPKARAQPVPAIWPEALLPKEPPSRPLRVFSRPEPVEALAAVPDGPPVRFRWRRMLIAVVRTEGPERIAPEWWRAPKDAIPLTRDYFRVEDQSGHRFWLFRDGLFETESMQPRWFLHGVFA